MNTATKLIVLALLTCACGPGGVHVDSSDETSDDNSSSSTSSSSSSSSETTDPAETTDPGESTETTDSGETQGFIPMNDMHEVGECDPFAQDCPDGEKCVPWASSGGSWDANKCVPILGDQAAGEPCTYSGAVEATDDCDATGICWDVMEIDGEMIGTCTPFCTGTADTPMCPEGSQCLISSDGPITLCIDNCDPILQDCNEGLACFWANISFNCIFTTQDIPPGQPCGFVNDCAAGNICLDAAVFPSCNGSACCSSYCDLDLPGTTCDVLPGTTCVPFFEENRAPPGYDHVGVCILPP